MPPKFNKCVKEGGRVRTKTLSDNKYVKGCSSDDGKTWVWGEVKEKKTGLMAGGD